MRFSKEHCWLEKTSNGVFVGITDFASKKLCKSFELFLCDEGDEIKADESLGEIISCEFFDIVSPINGKVVWVNDDLLNDPTPLKTEPFKNPLCKIEDAVFAKPLLSEMEYRTFCLCAIDIKGER